MQQQIKSIKLKESTKDLLNNEPPEGFTNTFQTVLDQYPEYFEIEYEPTLLKRPDGSLISEQEIEEHTKKIIRILQSYPNYKLAEEDYNGDYHYICLQQGLIFLPEDKHLAEKKAQMLTKQLEIQFEIDRLNAEEGSLGQRSLNESDIKANIYDKIRKVEITEKTADTILAKYSQDELKNYLGIII